MIRPAAHEQRGVVHSLFCFLLILSLLVQQQVSGGFGNTISSGSYPSGNVSASYSNVQGLTFATLGAGTTTVRNRPLLDITPLNRAPADMQRMTSSTKITLSIPELNIFQLYEDLKQAFNFVNALTTSLPDYVVVQGRQKVDQVQDLMLRGATLPQALALAETPAYRAALELRQKYEVVMLNGGGPEAARAMIEVAKGESVMWDQVQGVYRFGGDCATMGPLPCDVLVSAGQLRARYTDADVFNFFKTAYDAMNTAAGSNDPVLIMNARLAIECLQQITLRDQNPAALQQAIAYTGGQETFTQFVNRTGSDVRRASLVSDIASAVAGGDDLKLSHMANKVRSFAAQVGQNPELNQSYVSGLHNFADKLSDLIGVTDVTLRQQRLAGIYTLLSSNQPANDPNLQDIPDAVALFLVGGGVINLGKLGLQGLRAGFLFAANGFRATSTTAPTVTLTTGYGGAATGTFVDGVWTANANAIVNPLITFGKNENQIYHAWRHVLKETNLSTEVVRDAVIADLMPAARVLGIGQNYTGKIAVQGVNLEYRAFKLYDGSVNIGTIIRNSP